MYIMSVPVIMVFLAHLSSKTFWEKELWEIEPFDQNTTNDFKH
jgi:hypothetical protein